MQQRELTIRLVRLAMAAALIVPCLLFAFASWNSYRGIVALTDERLSHSLDVQQEGAQKTFDLVGLALSAADDLVAGMSDANIRDNQDRLHPLLEKVAEQGARRINIHHRRLAPGNQSGSVSTMSTAATFSTKAFNARDPNYVERIQATFARQGFLRHCGVRLEEIGPGRCIVAADFGDAVAQQHGYFHGGFIGALADAAGAIAASTLMEATQSLLTVEYKINLLAPAEGSTLRAVGDVVRSGRTLSVSQVHLFSVGEDDKEQLCALATVTVITLTSRGDGWQRASASTG